MANRFFNQFGKTLEKEVVSLFLHATFGASGAVTLDAVNSKGIASMTKIGTGAYRIVFGTTPASLDVYYKFFGMMPVFFKSGAAPAAPEMYITALNHNIVGSCSIDVQFHIGGVATNPGSGEQLYLETKLGNSSAQ
jgi:hypothetical protein